MDYMGKDKVSGNGNINLNVTSAGHTVGDAKRALNGDVAVALKNGAVKGFNLAHIIRQGQAALNGQPLQETAPQQTDFSAITASGKFIDGVLHSDQLDASAPLLRVTGAGTVDLVHQTIDYTAQPTVVNTTSAQGGKELASLNGVTVPIHVTGTFDQPKYSLDLKTAVKQKAVEKLTGKLTEQLDKKNPGLADQLRGLGGLFGKKQQNPPATNPPPH
jgi:AsmA protein